MSELTRLFPYLDSQYMSYPEPTRAGNFVLTGTRQVGHTEVREITVKTAVTPRGRGVRVTGYDINTYRGCAHGCVYCFARYTHGYMADSDFFGHVYAKVNVPEALERQLARGWKSGVAINLGSVTDPYQPIEASYRLTRRILEVLLRYRVPVSITTKSVMFLKDMDLLEELARVCGVQVRISLISPSKPLARQLEPYAPTPQKRFEALARCREAGCSTAVLMMPVLPYLTDSIEEIKKLYQEASHAGVQAVVAAPLRLRGSVREVFMNFLHRNHPRLVHRYSALYASGDDVDDSYASWLSLVVGIMSEYYRIPRELPPLGRPVVQRELFALLDAGPDGSCPV